MKRVIVALGVGALLLVLTSDASAQSRSRYSGRGNSYNRSRNYQRSYDYNRGGFDRGYYGRSSFGRSSYDRYRGSSYCPSGRGYGAVYGVPSYYRQSGFGVAVRTGNFSFYYRR